jgi:hypothetical protein
MKAINEMNLTELNDLLNVIKEEIKKRSETISSKVIFDPAKKFTRYNGGWTKRVTGIDKTKTNGYSILGDFTKTGPQYYDVNELYLDCGVGGSRKNQKNEYTLFTLSEKGDINIIAEIDRPLWNSVNNDWAIQMWEHIEAYQSK